jgi:formyltetrahydrofolate deformylase
MSDYVLTLRCDNGPGIVAAVATRLAENGGDITEAAQFDDALTGKFFMRVAFAMDRPIAGFERGFAEEIERLGLDWTLREAGRPRRVLILVSSFDHCLVDLLYRQRIGELDMDVVSIVSNHPRTTLARSEFADIPYHHFPVAKATRAQQEARVREVIEATRAELVVLARYMQVLSDELAGWLAGRCINIHHSFLPGFKSAKPYHQAHERGVKMIGATA